MAVPRYELYFRMLPMSITRERSERVRDTNNMRKYSCIFKRSCNVLFIILMSMK